jgi:predicted Na+-dependent transporter
MPIEGPVPGWALSIVAAVTLFTIMFDLGLAIVPGEFRWVVQRPALLLKALFSVLIAVPVLALVVARAFELPRAAEVGIVVMAISPGAPVALRRSLDAGGHRSFAPVLQIAQQGISRHHGDRARLFRDCRVHPGSLRDLAPPRCRLSNGD